MLSSLGLGFADRLVSPAPQGAYTTEYHPDGVGNHGYPYFVLAYEGGQTADASNIYVRDESGNEVAWADVWTAGDAVETGETLLMMAFTVPGDPDPPSGWC